MSLRLPYPSVYKFYNQFTVSDAPSSEQSSRSQGLRRSGPRSKFGCSTCKQRRVKCDETKPSCIRCQNLGRECGGYASDPDNPTHVPAVTMHHRTMPIQLQALSINIPGDLRDLRYFQRFCDKTAREMCGAFDPEFWTRKVLQLCQHDEPIRLGIIALGALGESVVSLSTPSRLSLSGYPQVDHLNMDEHHRYALKQYSKAIASLREILSNGQRHLRTSLVSCVLFMTFEAMQGNYDGSLTHLRGGTRLLADWRLALTGQDNYPSQNTRAEVQDGIVGDVARMFARFEVQGLFVPSSFPVPDLPVEDIVIPESFNTFERAREAWDFLMSGIAQFYRHSVTHAQENREELMSESWINRYEHLTHQLLTWGIAFQAVVVSDTRSNASGMDRTTMLSIYYNLATILLASSAQQTEMVYDEHSHLFAEIINKVNYLFLSTHDPNDSIRFTIDLGTTLPLFITALKCRDRRIRRQAISLLWSNIRREGLCFDTITIARLCSWLSSVEGVPGELQTIPEAARQRITCIHLSSEERSMAVQLTSATVKPSGNHEIRETTFSW